jgi:dynein heavy chain
MVKSAPLVLPQVAELADRLKAAAVEADEINSQERMFGWAATKYGHVSKMSAALEPFVTLWATLATFYDK